MGQLLSAHLNDDAGYHEYSSSETIVDVLVFKRDFLYDVDYFSVKMK